MVVKEKLIHLFIGEDSLSKDGQLKRLREENLSKEIEQFNLDILYAKELNLKDLQEKLLSLPVKAKKRLIVIKDAQALKEDSKGFLLKYVRNPHPKIILVLDISRKTANDEFINHIIRYSQVYRFKEALYPDTFSLSRQIELKRPDYSLKVLNQLLKNGEKPERILGGLRYSWERALIPPLERRKRLNLLLNCDIDIKTGRLKPQFALENLVVRLCSLNKPFS